MCRYKNIQSDEQYTEWKKDSSLIPFVFTYNGKTYKGFPFLKKAEEIERIEEKETIIQKFVLDDNIEIKLILTHYYDYGATEFTVWFENNGKENSGILEDPHLDMCIEAANPILRGILGDHQHQYKPYAYEAKSLKGLYFGSENGRATHIYFPYFNLEYDYGGMMLAIGWAGRWESMFESKGEKVRYIARYAMGIKTYLKPNEKIRTPLFLIAAYIVRDEYYATNYWRSWFMKYNLPKADADGNELKPFSTCSLAGDTGLENCDGSISENKDTWKRSLDKLFSEEIHFDYRWMDAGYYPDPSGATRYDYWGYVGVWEFDYKKWGENGKGFIQSVDYAHKHNVRTLLWTEPERVCMVDALVQNYAYNADWAIRQFPKEYPFSELYIMNNIADPECLKWTEKQIFKLLRDNKIDLFREDYNRDPAYAWLKLDKKESPNRWGINECKGVAAHYQFLEDVIECTASYGGCAFVDSCASGGGRNDLQSLRYAVPVLRSDSDRTTTALRLSMTSSFCKWIPFHGACHLEKENDKECEQDGKSDVYTWRASYLPILNVLGGRFTQDENYDFEMLRFGLAEWEKVNFYLTKDFYPLTPWRDKSDKTGFTAHCYMDSETMSGVLLAFRMEDCRENFLQLTLPFIKEGEIYSFTDEDSGECIIVKTGNIELNFDLRRTARLLWVKKV